MYNIKVEKTKVELDVQISNEEWENAVETVYQHQKNNYSVEGFRKGKAPRKVIEKNYGANVFFDDALNYYIDNVITEVMRKTPEHEPATQPMVELLSSNKDTGLKAKVTYEIVPDFKLCKYTGLTIKVPDTKVEDEEIEDHIQGLLRQNATFNEVDRPIQNGDSAMIDFIGFIDGVEFDGGSAKDYPLEIGSNSFIDTFEEQLIGHSKGETVDVNVTFPKDYAAEEMQGKKAVFSVTIKAVREMNLPTLDDKFISNATEFETVEEYKKDVFEHIQTMKQEEQTRTFDLDIRKHIIDNTEIELPQAMIDRSVSNEIAVMTNYAKKFGLPLEQLVMQMYGTNLAEYQERVANGTRHRTKLRYIFRKIIREQNITLTPEEEAEATKGLTDEHEKDSAISEKLAHKIMEFLRTNNKMEIDESLKLYL